MAKPVGYVLHTFYPANITVPVIGTLVSKPLDTPILGIIINGIPHQLNGDNVDDISIPLSQRIILGEGSTSSSLIISRVSSRYLQGRRAAFSNNMHSYFEDQVQPLQRGDLALMNRLVSAMLRCYFDGPLEEKRGGYDIPGTKFWGYPDQLNPFRTLLNNTSLIGSLEQFTRLEDLGEYKGQLVHEFILPNQHLHLEGSTNFRDRR